MPLNLNSLSPIPGVGQAASQVPQVVKSYSDQMIGNAIDAVQSKLSGFLGQIPGSTLSKQGSYSSEPIIFDIRQEATNMIFGAGTSGDDQSWMTPEQQKAAGYSTNADQLNDKFGSQSGIQGSTVDEDMSGVILRLYKNGDMQQSSIDLVLPLPNNLEFESTYKWNSPGDSSDVEKITTQILQGHFGENAWNDAVGLAQKTVFGAGGAGAALSAKMRASANLTGPILFGGVIQRSFNYTFNIAYKGMESMAAFFAVLNIIHQRAAPNLTNSEIYHWPDIGQLFVLDMSKRIIHDRVVAISGIKTNLSPHQVFASYISGYPLNVELSISFQELLMPDQVYDAEVFFSKNSNVTSQQALGDFGLEGGQNETIPYSDVVLGGSGPSAANTSTNFSGESNTNIVGNTPLNIDNNSGAFDVAGAINQNTGLSDATKATAVSQYNNAVSKINNSSLSATDKQTRLSQLNQNYVTWANGANANSVTPPAPLSNTPIPVDPYAINGYNPHSQQAGRGA